MNILTYNMTTCMGKCIQQAQLSFLSQEEIVELNEIGYTGKNSEGIKTTREEYLNSLNKGLFKVEQLTYNNGDFFETFLIIRVI